MMKAQVCFVCLKTNKISSLGGNIGGGLYSKFWNFARDYIGIKSVADKENSFQLLSNEAFCEDCENVVDSLCQGYRELLQVQVRLSSKLGELLRLLECSESGVSHKLGRMLIKALAEQLGFGKTADVDELRSLLKKKCKLKRQETLPEILIPRVNLPPTFAFPTLAKNLKLEITPDDDDHDDAHTSPCSAKMVEVEDTHSISSEGSSKPDDLPPFERFIDIVTSGSGVESESENENPEIKIEPLEVEEEEMDGDDEPIYELNRKEETDSDSTFEPDASPEHSSTESDSDSQSDWELQDHSRKVKGTSTSKKNPHDYFLGEEDLSCPTCSKVFDTKPKLRRHIYKVHNGRTPCPKCTKSFKTRGGLNEHLIDIHKIDPHVCQDPNCQETFKTIALFRSHMKTSHPKPPTKGKRKEIECVCSHCGKVLPSNQRLRHHIYQVHRGHPFNCPECSKPFKTKGGLKQHILMSHKRKASAETQSNSDSKTKTHAKKATPSSTSKIPREDEFLSPTLPKPRPQKRVKVEGEFLCQNCGKVCPSRKRLSHHMRQVHPSSRFQCPECKNSFKTKGGLKQHMVLIHKPETHICSECGKIFKNSLNLRCHVNYVHLKKRSNSTKAEPTPCETCGKTFASLHSKNLHISRIHANQEDSPCPFCGKIFRSALRMTTHINKTHSDKRYKCDECGVELKSKVLLSNHIIAFHKPEAHDCPHCGKTFKSPAYLQGHIDNVHRGVLKRYSCPNCVIIYSHRNKLNRHLLKCTKDRPLYVRTSKVPGAHNHFRTVVRWDDTADPDADGKFPCPKCPKIFETAGKRSAHVRHVHVNVNFTCEECGVVRKSNTSLRRHIDAFHKPKDRVCPHCGKTLATGYMAIHIKLIHSELAPKPRVRVQCPSCPEGFYTTRQLEKHRLECGGRKEELSEQNAEIESNNSQELANFSLI